MSNHFTDSFQLTAALFSQFTALLQLRYSANDDTHTPFATHPTTMFAAVSIFMLYYFLHITLLRSPAGRFAAVAQHFLVWSGFAAVSTLAAALFPDSATPFLYVIFGLLLAAEGLYMLGNKLIHEDEDEHGVEGQASTFKIYTRRIRWFLINICWQRVAKYIQKQHQPILPI